MCAAKFASKWIFKVALQCDDLSGFLFQYKWWLFTIQMHEQHYHPNANESRSHYFFVIFSKAEPSAPALPDGSILFCLWLPVCWASAGLHRFSSLFHGQNGMKRTHDRDDRKLVMPNGRSNSSSEGIDSSEPSGCSTLFQSKRPRSCLVPGEGKKWICKWDDGNMADALQSQVLSKWAVFVMLLPGTVLSRTKPRKPPMNIWVVKNMCSAWSTSLTPVIRYKYIKQLPEVNDKSIKLVPFPVDCTCLN